MTTHPARPYRVEFFMPDGTPAGLRLVKQSHWTGCGLVFPRSVFPKAKVREEFGRAGIYLLMGPTEDGDLPTFYIGQGDPVRIRLEQHYANKDFWVHAVAFVSTNGWLNTAYAQYLEGRLVQQARLCHRAKLDNQNLPRIPALAEADREDAESFLADILRLLPLLGVTEFELAPTATPDGVLTAHSQKISAQGYDSPQGFVVTAGSQASLTTVPSVKPAINNLRRHLQEQGVLVVEDDHLVFTESYAFSAPSTAATVVLGSPANGRIVWKDASGRTLGQIQEAEARPDSGS